MTIIQIKAFMYTSSDYEIRWNAHDYFHKNSYLSMFYNKLGYHI